MRKTRRRTKPTDLAIVRRQREANLEKAVQETIAKASRGDLAQTEREPPSQCKMVAWEERR